MADSATIKKEINGWYQDLLGQVESNKHIFDDQFDLECTRQIIEKVVSKMNDVYFRAEFVGFENFPKRNNPDRPLIFASNHSGMAFPWDAIVLASEMFKRHNYGADAMRPLSSVMLSGSSLMNPFMYKDLWKIVGSVDATFLNFETMLHQNDHNLLIYPEGVSGIGKGFDKKYQLQRFSTSFITLAIKYRTDIVPIYTVNGEYINPYAYRNHWVNAIVQKIGIPYLPLGITTPIIFLQPWFFYAALPAKLVYVLGEAIKPYEMTDKPIEEMSLEEVRSICNLVKDQMQYNLLEAEKKYGQQPYKVGELANAVITKTPNFPYELPFAWPLLFSAFKQHYKGKSTRNMKLKLGWLSVFRILWKNPMDIFFYVPILGWIPLLIKGFGKRDKNMEP